LLRLLCDALCDLSCKMFCVIWEMYGSVLAPVWCTMACMKQKHTVNLFFVLSSSQEFPRMQSMSRFHQWSKTCLLGSFGLWCCYVLYSVLMSYPFKRRLLKSSILLYCYISLQFFKYLLYIYMLYIYIYIYIFNCYIFPVN
jgi:hypothetical protein